MTLVLPGKAGLLRTGDMAIAIGEDLLGGIVGPAAVCGAGMDRAALEANRSAERRQPDLVGMLMPDLVHTPRPLFAGWKSRIVSLTY